MNLPPSPPQNGSPADRMRAWHAARTPRERGLLVLAAAALIGGGLIAVAEHLATERERLARSLPAARLAYLSMTQDSLGLATLRDRPATTPPPLAALPDSIRAAAKARAIEAEVRTTGDLLEVNGRATLPALVEWLAALHAEQRLRPGRLELESASEGGQAGFKAVFERGGR